MSSKFFGNSKIKNTHVDKTEKLGAPRNVKKTTAVKKTGRGK